MSVNKVTVLLPNARRQTIKVSPNKTILEILEEACQKHDLSSEDFDLKHHNRILDLAQMFRFAGLPNNCLLEMIESTQKREHTDVVLCFQLEDGTRPQGIFNPTQKLLDIMEELCPEKSAPDKNPVAIYMRKEIYGAALGTTTLKSLGITGGRAIIRVVNKNPEDLKIQANVYIPPVVQIKASQADFPKQKPSTGTSSAAKAGVFDGLVDTIKQIKDEKLNKSEPEPKSESIPMDVDVAATNPSPRSAGVNKKYDWGVSVGNSLNGKALSQSAEQEDDNHNEEDEEGIESQICTLGERNAVLFSLNEAQRVPDELPDAFFDLTVHDLQYLLRDLRRQTSELSNSPLLTNKLRELEDSKRVLNKLGQYKKSVIRVQFPNRLVLQGSFTPVETIQTVEDFVRNYLQDSSLDFYLFTIPPKRIMQKDLTLVEADCVPTAVLHFGTEGETTGEILQPELLSKLTTPDGAIVAASRSRGVTCVRRDLSDETKENRPGPSTGAIPKQPRVDSFKPSSAAQPSTGQVPKWFKPTGK